MEQIFKFIGEAILYGGGIAGIAFLIFRFLGKRWIESVFSERLQRHKHELAKELEQHRYKVNTLFSRVTKIHEKEFEVLPESWLKMQDALGRMSDFVSIFKNWPDLGRMSEAALDEFLSKSRLHDYEKEEVRKSSGKLDCYQKTIFWHDMHQVEKAFSDFHNYIIRNKIFLGPALQKQFSDIDDIMWSAIGEMKESEGDAGHEMCVTAYKKIRDDVNPIRDKIEEMVQSRLHYTDVE